MGVTVGRDELLRLLEPVWDVPAAAVGMLVVEEGS